MSIDVDAIAKLAESLPKNVSGPKRYFGVLPDGKQLSKLDDDDLARALKALDIPGAGKSRDQNVTAWENFVREKWNDAGETWWVLFCLDHEDDSGQSANGENDSEDDDVRDPED